MLVLELWTTNSGLSCWTVWDLGPHAGTLMGLSIERVVTFLVKLCCGFVDPLHRFWLDSIGILVVH